MNKCILLGIDAPLSPATRQAIRTITGLLEPMAPQVRLVLLHVLSLPYVTSPALGMYSGQLHPDTATVDQQRLEAEKVLAAVRAMLEEQTPALLRVDVCIRQGSPSDEITRAASELHADLIIVGSRGSRTGERLRRFFLGSKSRRVLQSSLCPVMIVSLPSTKRPADLAAWYEEAITRYLHEDPGGLRVFTPGEVARFFPPPSLLKDPGRKERAAAVLALEHLARTGVLCRHEVQGELRYVND
ncbi:MAG TPA: universal stress protein [Ktedonobacteraceae bacterium]